MERFVDIVMGRISLTRDKIISDRRSEPNQDEEEANIFKYVKYHHLWSLRLCRCQLAKYIILIKIPLIERHS
jgi:hypothetical protein